MGTYGHRYTPEEQEFMEEYVPGHSYMEITEAFREKFGWEISITQVKAYIGNHHLRTGTTGRFPKGHIPHNRDRKGTCASGSEKGWFPKGHTPANHRPVGSERVNVDGYVEVKVAEPDRWRQKHRVVWKAANGKVPKGHVIIFRDNDKTNTSIDNLLLVRRGTHAVMNHTGLCAYGGEYKDTAVMIAELKSASSGAKKRMGSSSGKGAGT